ncbi:LOW QUALITY PROTEIN: TRPM8 channel-associated factor 2-like [Cariama cristata]
MWWKVSQGAPQSYAHTLAMMDWEVDALAGRLQQYEDVNSSEFTTNYHPCELLVIEDEAFPVLVSTYGQVLIAASCYGKGRMVVVSHEGILKDSKFSPFLRNAVEWLKPSPEALVGVHPHLDSLSQLLLRADTKVQAGAQLSPSLGVFCMDAYDSTQAKDLVGFVKAGGGLLVGGQAWHWASQHGKEKALFEFPGNQVTSVAGVYFTGKMDVSAWQSTICQYPAPWAELATENIVLAVPAADVHCVANPESLLSIWNKMMNAITTLAAVSATFPRPERLVADVQISHSKYRCHSLLGHNQHQSEDFPPHTAKATCNLWSVYVKETVLGIPREKAHSALALELRKKRIQDYIEKGAQLKNWEVFTVPETYL